ncbi:hypothetical protein [Dyadobacter sp. CY326]|uniref:hypothetical protein n=1 Tax=Dyadobacter sp. CY326 TaxID=2907300 RepID=UPI001F1E26AF|nr:hypothetical protein [Dyadobacter sp. CY326]MCE7063855.1 hypothetical protein [Dyadobacter sp. CY326]
MKTHLLVLLQLVIFLILRQADNVGFEMENAFLERSFPNIEFHFVDDSEHSVDGQNKKPMSGIMLTRDPIIITKWQI